VVVVGGLPSRDSKGEADWKMKGQKVASMVKGEKKEKKNGGGGAGASAAASPAVSAVSRNQFIGPSCTGCGIVVGKDALQGDRCCRNECWKCTECLGISAKVYDMLFECKELCWFCKSCSEEVSKVRKEREDRIIGLLEKVMDKLTDMEMRMMNKVDVKEFEELELKVRGLESSVKDCVDELEGRVAASEAKFTQKEGVGSCTIVKIGMNKRKLSFVKTT